MNHWFFMKCFLIGVLASSGIGPIFILTFNRSAMYGFSHGLATALGAGIGDTLFFALSLRGILGAIQSSPRIVMLLDALGGIILLFVASHLLKKTYQTVSLSIGEKESLHTTFLKSFILTILNPMTIFFFIVITMKFFPSLEGYTSLHEMMLGCSMVTLGSLSVLGSVSFVASFIGHNMQSSTLRIISYISGIGFFLFGLYLLSHFFIVFTQGL